MPSLPLAAVWAVFAADRPAGPIVDACRDRGLLILTAGEKILRMTPPLIVDESDADRAVAIVGDALRQSKP